jgi:AcrR family transcriptional regulator
VARRLSADVAAATQGAPDGVRRHILAAARRVIDSQGLTAASTRAIAREAGVSGGTVYNYFANHTQLLAASIVHRADAMAGPARDLPDRAGHATVVANLEYFVEQAAAILDQLIPSLAAAFADTALLDAVRGELAGVALFEDPVLTVLEYLHAEAGLGRISSAADCGAAASLIVSMCHDDAFSRFLTGRRTVRRPRRDELALIVKALTA